MPTQKLQVQKTFQGYSVKSNIDSCWATGDVHGSISVKWLDWKFDMGEWKLLCQPEVTGSNNVGLVGKLIGYLTTKSNE